MYKKNVVQMCVYYEKARKKDPYSILKQLLMTSSYSGNKLKPLMLVLMGLPYKKYNIHLLCQSRELRTRE